MLDARFGNGFGILQVTSSRNDSVNGSWYAEDFNGENRLEQNLGWKIRHARMRNVHRARFYPVHYLILHCGVANSIRSMKSDDWAAS